MVNGVMNILLLIFRVLVLGVLVGSLIKIGVVDKILE